MRRGGVGWAGWGGQGGARLGGVVRSLDKKNVYNPLRFFAHSPAAVSMKEIDRPMGS